MLFSVFLYETSSGRNNEPQNSRISNRGILKSFSFEIRYSIFSFEVSSSIKLAAPAASGWAVFLSSASSLLSSSEMPALCLALWLDDGHGVGPFKGLAVPCQTAQGCLGAVLI